MTNYDDDDVLFSYLWYGRTIMQVVCTHRALLTEAVDALLGVHELDRDVALSLVDEDLPVRGQMDDHGCCHHGVREVGLGKTSRDTKVVLKSCCFCNTDIGGLMPLIALSISHCN